MYTASDPQASLTGYQQRHAAQDNAFALFEAMAALPGGELVKTARLSYHHASPFSPIFKGVWNARLDPAEIEPAVEEVVAWFQERGAPFLFWWFGPGSNPSGLAEALTAHGFEVNIEGDPSMIVELRALNEDIRTSDNFRIVRAADRQTLEDWGGAFAAAFEIPEWAGQAWVDATLAFGIEDAPWTLYVGYQDDTPVATNILFNGAGVAGLYGVGTIPEARGQGIGAAITLQPLLDARAQGMQYGALFATEMGEPVYRRLGFRLVRDSEIGRWLKRF